MPEYRWGRTVNRQQGPQDPSVGKSNPGSSYQRSSQRASPSGNTPGFKSDFRAEREATAKKHNLGRHSRQRLFP